MAISIYLSLQEILGMAHCDCKLRNCDFKISSETKDLGVLSPHLPVGKSFLFFFVLCDLVKTDEH